VCTSRVGLVAKWPDTMISYSIEATADTAVYCKVSGSACEGTAARVVSVCTRVTIPVLLFGWGTFALYGEA
jgi:hypothetical protein